jgi:hypothetical protein
MIQRVQSVYLLLVTVLMSLFFAKPYAEVVLGNNEIIRLYTWAMERHLDAGNAELIKRTIPLLTLVLLTGMVSFLNIFLYQKRPLQMRICVLASVMLIVQLGLVSLYFARAKADYKPLLPSFNLVAIFPVVCIILLIMAYRAINHDETLVKSYHRIR